MSLGQLAKDASRMCGLPKATCMTLLEAGWQLESKMGEPTQWVSPMAQTVVGGVIAAGAMSGSVTSALKARLSYDTLKSESAAAEWLKQENALSDLQFIEYQRAYQQQCAR